MRSLTRSVAAVCGAVLLAVTVVGCSKEGEEEPGFSTVSPSNTEEAAEEEDISATQENSKESAPECTEAALERDLGEGNALGWTILECEGDFAFVAHKSSDYLIPIIWENGGMEGDPGRRSASECVVVGLLRPVNCGQAGHRSEGSVPDVQLRHRHHVR